MSKKEVVDAILANEASGWLEDDRDVLMDLNEDTLGKIAANAAAVEDDITDTSTDDAAEGEDTATTDKKGNKKPGKGKLKNAVDANDPVNGKGKAPKQALADDEDAEDQAPNENMSAEEYIANAPEGIRDMLATGLASYNAEKGRIINSITANKANTFTSEFLETKGMEELRAIAKLAVNAAPKTNRYLGDAAPMTNAQAQIDMPIMPKMDFSKK